MELFLDDDGDYVAHLAEMPNVLAFGPTAQKALAELAIAWELVKESYAEENRPFRLRRRPQYGGIFNVRIDKRVHRALAIEAGPRGR